MEFGLGTAQFGMDYGISNRTGKIVIEEAVKILSDAQAKGVRAIDTAPAYGSSEEVLGQLLPQRHTFEICTKTAICSADRISSVEINKIRETFYHSLERMRQKSVYGLLVHHSADLHKPGALKLLDLLLHFQQEKLVEKIGVSIYNARQDLPDQFLRDHPIGMVQLPYNIFDRRYEQSTLQRLALQGRLEVQIRSIFMQGLLLMQPPDVPKGLSGARAPLTKFLAQALQTGISPAQAAIHFARACPGGRTAILGVNTFQQWRQNLDLWNTSGGFDAAGLAVEDEQLIDPSQWRLQKS